MVIAADSLHRQRRQRIVALVAHAGRVDGSVGADGDGGDLAPRGLEEHVALALRIDAVDQAGAVGAGDQIALRVPGQSADVRLVALEEQLRRGARLGGIDAVDGSGIAGGDVEPPGGVEGQIPDVVGLRARRGDEPCSGRQRSRPAWRRRRRPWQWLRPSFVVASGLSL